MSTASNKDTVRRLRDAFNAGDLDGALAVFAADAVVHASVVHASGASASLTMEDFG